MKRLFIALSTTLAALIPVQAMAVTWQSTTKVVWIESSAVPENLFFGLVDSGGSGCTRLTWAPPIGDQNNRAGSMQATLAVLMTALAANRKVQVYGNPDCTTNFIYLN